MNQKPRILFICYADSPHAQSWINLLQNSGLDTRVFSYRLLSQGPGWAPDWNFPTYITIRPKPDLRIKSKVFSVFPAFPRARNFFSWLDARFSISERYLYRVIREWRPDIIHSMPLDKAGKLTRLAYQRLPAENRPKWVASSWGSDIFWGLDDPEKSSNVKAILAHCDGFTADCQRDLNLAVGAGLDPSKLAFGEPVPGSGGLDLDAFLNLRHENLQRNLIVVPKAFERPHANQPLPILEAFRLLGEGKLHGYVIQLNMCSKIVRAYLQRMPAWLQNIAHCNDMLPQDELFTQMAQARVMVAPSLSDGTPNVMLEAMAAGALPLMSPIDSHQEWISNGDNGLLAHALYPDQIAKAVDRALTDDSLFDRAQRLNWEIVSQRADRKKIREQVIEHYRNLCSG